MKKSIVIFSPALADANNGNWQTASRWSRMLAPDYRTRIVRAWPDGEAAGDAMMIALHARRSAQAIEAWARVHGSAGLALVLTGTDLYRDIKSDAAARRSLELAQALVVLQELGTQSLPARMRAKARVIFQSTSERTALDKTHRHLRAVMVGHLREVKSPQTLFEAARLLAHDSTILIDHIGDALEPRWGREARATAAACPNYRWLGGLPHEAVRRHIQRAHVLVHTSRIEGGAHVVMEAVRSGTPVLASDAQGNVGMLGAAYPGYFAVGDAKKLARLLAQCRDGLARGEGLLPRLQAARAKRSHLFRPAVERAALHRLVKDLIAR